MDKSWSKLTNRFSKEYVDGAKAFLEMSKSYANDEGIASCPCANYLNAKAQPTKTIFHHIVQFGFDQSYDVWVNHGEILPGFEDIEQSYEVDSDGEEVNDDIDELLRDAFATSDDEEHNEDEGTNVTGRHNNPDVEQLFVDMEKPLFTGC